jgi:haloacid dehalogenase superfamily, subfamily IA, variant 3 with third motif having DD or ED
MIKGAIFDLDGTLLDSMHAWNRAPRSCLESLGIKAEPGLEKVLFTMSMTEGAEFLKKRYGLDMTTDEIISEINRTMERFYTSEAQLKDGVYEFLAGMKEHGTRMAIATSTDRSVFIRALERLRVKDFFDGIFTTSEIGFGKTNPAIYRTAAGNLGTEPYDTWVFEDALYAIRTAKDAGFRTVGVYDPSSGEDWEEIKRISDIHMEKLDDVRSFLERASK